MTIENKLMQVVDSANRLTEAVNNKIVTIDDKLLEAQNQFEQWRKDRELVGPNNMRGSIRMNILQGFVGATGGEWGVHNGEDLGTCLNVYMHFITPLNINQHNEMYWFDIQGYSFASKLLIDEKIAGYCYKDNNSLINKVAKGNLSPLSYTDKNGQVIFRLKCPNIYYTTFAVNTMKVGNGRLFKHGDLTLKLSLNETIKAS